MLRLAVSPLCALAIASLALSGYTATWAQELFPGIPAESISQKPLAGPPAVLSLEHRPAAEMRTEDAGVVASMTAELGQKTGIAGFDIGRGGWVYEQIVCPAFPDFVFLAFRRDSEPSGSSRFVAVLERNASWVRVVATVSEGTLPLGSAWSRPGVYEIFNYMLRRERGIQSLGSAPAWLSIAMSLAELSGHHVQVFVPEPLPASTLDLSRLGANQPQLYVDATRSAEVTFSDAAKPGTTTDWLLRFDQHGQILSASRGGERQPAKIALHP